MTVRPNAPSPTLPLARLWGAALTGMALLLWTDASAHAQVPVPLASSNGNASAQTATFGVTPSAGTQAFLLTTINPMASLPMDGSLGTTSSNTNVTALNGYLGLVAGTLAARNVADGSAYLSQTVTLTLNAQFTFDCVFLTDEDTTATGGFQNDFALFTVNGAVNQTLKSVSDLDENDPNQFSPSNNFDFQSFGAAPNGFTRVTYTAPAAGNYTFGFGVFDVGVNTVYSGLLIDNLSYSLVPEPGVSAILVLGTGLGTASVYRARRRV